MRLLRLLGLLLACRTQLVTRILPSRPSKLAGLPIPARGFLSVARRDRLRSGYSFWGWTGCCKKREREDLQNSRGWSDAFECRQISRIQRRCQHSNKVIQPCDKKRNVPCEQIVGIARPYNGHSLNEFRDLLRRKGSSADENSLSVASIGGVFWLDFKNACVRIGMAAIAVLSAKERDATVVQPHSHPVEIPVYCWDCFWVFRVLQVVYIELYWGALRMGCGHFRVRKRGEGS